MDFTGTLIPLDIKSASNTPVIMISSSGFSMITAKIIESHLLMTASYMLFTNKALSDSFNALEAFLSIRRIICTQRLNESYPFYIALNNATQTSIKGKILHR
jgi:hypothetical protein